MTPVAGTTGTADLVVGEADTAAALGSGDLAVLGTPRLAALMEQAACAAVAEALPPGASTVGVHLDLHHLAASSVGAHMRAVATVRSVDGRRIRFDVVAEQVGDPGAPGMVVGSADHTRVVVDRARFLAGAHGPASSAPR